MKYCFDMKLLKIEIISPESNIILAKTYINFLNLGNNWKGEKVSLNIPLFSSNLSLNSLKNLATGASRNQKIIG